MNKEAVYLGYKDSSTPLVSQLVREVQLSQKKVDALPAQVMPILAITLIQQKKALSKLQQLANDGSAIAGIGYVKACCISGLNIDSIFNYQEKYISKDSEAYLKILFQPQNLLPFLHQYQALRKVKSVASFALEVPDLTQYSFSPKLYDSLQVLNKEGKTFGDELASGLNQAYMDAKDSETERSAILKVIRKTAQKGYAPVQNLYARILTKNKNFTEARSVYQSVLLNKFSNQSDKTYAKRGLSFVRMFPYRQLNATRVLTR